MSFLAGVVEAAVGVIEAAVGVIEAAVGVIEAAVGEATPPVNLGEFACRHALS